jgi:hypothetical protein
MRIFLKELDALANEREVELELTFCGSRNSAYQDFVKAGEDYRNAFVALLVDSEGPVTHPPWRHLPRGGDVALISADELSSLLEAAHLLRSPKHAERLLAAISQALSG